ncbi:MAG: Ig-like domain-containing protein [Armatimonadota bacterium]|nr:Ig-like domain-containing protein [Armatimonadota bacterium]
MKFFTLVSIGAFALAVIGCGGGGSGGGGGGGPFSIVRVESPSTDPLNILVGQSVQFELAGYEQGSGNRVVLQATSWSVLDNPAVGTINGNGSFTGALPGNARIGATWNGTPTVTPLPISVRPQGIAGLAGSVRNGGTAVRGVVVVFYNAGNTEVGRATSMADGSFRAWVPTTATRMNLDTTTLDGRWLRQWDYLSETYQAGQQIPNCHATFVLTGGVLTNGETRTISGPVQVFDLNTPPPFPSGCI